VAGPGGHALGTGRRLGSRGESCPCSASQGTIRAGVLDAPGPDPRSDWLHDGPAVRL